MQRSKISLRHLFTTAERRPDVYFYTSNTSKFIQAHLVFQRAGLPLRQFASYTKPYFEDYSGTTEQLLLKAVREVIDHVGHASLVFIEDTTVRIEALSELADFPGFRTKEWFESTTFDELDGKLISAGNDRRCVVRSDIALHIPNLEKPLIVHGETVGVVAGTPPRFKSSDIYPWLTSDSFNGWFIPDGSTLRLGEMDLDTSLAYDFRVKALNELLDRLEQITAALNLPLRAFVRQEQSRPIGTLPLFPSPIYIIVGLTCAGKTTAASFLEVSRGWVMIEASTVMRELADRLGLGTLTGVEMALNVTRIQGRDAVAREIASRLRANEQYVISGLRFIEEVDYLKHEFPGRIRLVFVETPRRLRLSRLLARRRDGDRISTIEELAERDLAQEELGLIPYARKLADIKLDNAALVDDYYRKLNEVTSGSAPLIQSVPVTVNASSDQGLRCLRVLARARRELTNHEIAALSGEFGPSIRHNNVNKVLKRMIGLVRRIDRPREPVRYEILPAGYAYLQLAESSQSIGAQISH